MADITQSRTVPRLKDILKLVERVLSVSPLPLQIVDARQMRGPGPLSLSFCSELASQKGQKAGEYYSIVRGKYLPVSTFT